MLKRYPQLQSGFVSLTENFLEKPGKPETTPFTNLIVANPKTRTQEEYFYSPLIEELINQALQNPIAIRSFEYQEKLFHGIGELFDRLAFSHFVAVQENNQRFSTTHLMFLEETINIALGLRKQRTISIQSWSSLLSSANRDFGNFRASQLLSKFENTGFMKMSLADFVSSWVLNAGFSDLIISLQAIFGRRTLHALYGTSL